MPEAFAHNFPPLSRSRSSHAGVNRGHDTADRGASCALRIERARVRTAERAAAVARLKEDLARLYRDTTAFRAEEARLKTQAESETWRGGQQREVLLNQQLELRSKLEEFARNADLHRAHAKEWHEELETLERHQALAADQVDVLDKANVRLKGIAAEHQQRLTRAEARLKKLEARRVQTKSEVAKLQQELSQQLEAKTTEEEVSTAQKGSSEMASAGASKARAKQIRKGSEQHSRTAKDPKEKEELKEAGEQKSQVILLFLLVLVVAVGPYFFAQLLD
ncbi:CKMT2 [Symbiodinium sp. CCMP2592]|nr:CKMT2 [Symbiodinium sp. CCMP2592]